MYRNSSQISYASKVNRLQLLPSPDSTSDDSEADIVEVLDVKRKQLNEEIAKFKSAKDKEFQAFETELRTKKQMRRKNDTRFKSTEDRVSQPEAKKRTSSTNSGGATGALSLLAGRNKPSEPTGGVGSSAQQETTTKNNTTRKTQATRPAPLCKPTLSIERLTISGETTPPLSAFGTPPSTKLTKTISRSPSNTNSLVFTPPKQRNSKKQLSPSTPVSEVPDSFVGIFAPSYLPLLESHSEIQSEQPLSEAQPTKSNPSKRPNSIPGALQPSSIQSLSPSVGSDASPRIQRALTAPVILPSTHLPSALRTSSNGNVTRKSKRVTFQLADSAIVEPSSSYEEGISPDIEEGRVVFLDDRTIDEVLAANTTPSKSDSKVEDESTDELVDENTMQASEQDARFDAVEGENKSLGQRQLRSPTIRGRERERTFSGSSFASNSPDLGTPQSLDTSPPGLKITEAADGGSGVGFFELDEELSSPVSTMNIKSLTNQSGQADDGPELEDDINDGELRDNDHDGVNDDEPVELHMTKLKYEYSGSVPIDIARPSGSWVGSFGH